MYGKCDCNEIPFCAPWCSSWKKSDGTKAYDDQERLEEKISTAIKDDLGRPLTVFIEPTCTQKMVNLFMKLWSPDYFKRICTPETYALINGCIRPYDLCDKDKNAYADLDVRCVGKGRIHSVKGVKQRGFDDYYFFVWN